MTEDNTKSVGDLKGNLIAWLKESGFEKDPTKNPYITESGLAYLNGYCQSNDTINLIKQEKYDEVLKDFEELIEKYTFLKEKNVFLIKQNNKLRNNWWNKIWN